MYSEPIQASKMELFPKIVNSIQPLTFLAKLTILEMFHGVMIIHLIILNKDLVQCLTKKL